MLWYLYAMSDLRIIHVKSFVYCTVFLYMVIGVFHITAPVFAQDGQQPNWVYEQTPTPSATDNTQSTEPNWVYPTPIDQIQDVQRSTSSLILAHYMTWYKTPEISGRWQHWQWDPDGDGGQDAEDRIPDRTDSSGLRQLAAVHYPVIGPYDSSDPDVIEYQVALAWASGIDGFVVDWYGPNDYGDTDKAFRLTFEKVKQWREQYGLEFWMAITYEEQILTFDNLPAEQYQQTIQEHWRYILNEYAGSPAYLHYGDLPLLFFWQMWIDGKPGLLTPEQLTTAKDQVSEFHLLYMGAETEYLDVSDGFYSWVTGANENPEDWGSDYLNWVYPEMDYRTEKHGLNINIGGVWAGFNDSSVGGWGRAPRYIDPQGNNVYKQTWEHALNAKINQKSDYPSWLQIITWNDWNEGTEIEPSLEFGQTYLLDTQQYAAQYTGRILPPTALRIPEVIFKARKHSPGSETEAIINEVYPLFFSGNFDEAWAILVDAGLTISF